MRDLRILDKWRRRDRAVIERFGNAGDHTCGLFEVPSPIDGQAIRVIASIGEGWEHASASRKNRCPNWHEMSFVKEIFFEPNETVMQLHVPRSDHINVHPFCLHLWRPLHVEIPRPPSWMVG